MAQNKPRKHNFNDQILVHYLNVLIISIVVNHCFIFWTVVCVCVCVLYVCEFSIIKNSEKEHIPCDSVYIKCKKYN